MAVVIKGSGSIEGSTGLEMGANGTTEIRGQVNVAVGSSVAGVSTATNFAPTTVPTGHRNIMINGSMQVAQRATSSTSGTGYNTVDRFRVNFTGNDETPTQAQHALTSSDTGPWAEGFRYSLHLTNGNQTSGAGAADVSAIQHRIEAQNLAQSGWNYTSTSSYLTLSFWVQSSVAQNFYGHIRAIDGTAQCFPFETGALSANTWKKVTVKIPGNSNITVDNNNDYGMHIEWVAFRGTDTTGSVSLNAWAAYNASIRNPDCTSTWYTTNDSTFEITGVQLEVGQVATPFEHRTYGDELARCMRYYQQWGATGQDGNFCVGASHLTSGGDQTRNASMLPTMLRAAPTITEFGNGLKVFGSGSEVSVTNIQDINVTNGSNMLCWTCEHTDIGDNNEIVVVCNTDNGGATLSAEL